MAARSRDTFAEDGPLADRTAADANRNAVSSDKEARPAAVAAKLYHDTVQSSSVTSTWIDGTL